MPLRVSQPSFQSLYVEMRAFGQKIGSGTAFVVTGSSGEHFLLTARHCVTGYHHDTGKLLDDKNAAIPDALVIWHNSSSVLGEFVQLEIPLYEKDGTTPRWIEHPFKKVDFVAFPVLPREEITVHPYEVDYVAHRRIEPASRVHVVGFPFGRKWPGFAVWATGFVASEPEHDYDGEPIFLIDCRTRKGQSGSPVIQYFHSNEGLAFESNPMEPGRPLSLLLGLYSARINKESDLGIVWKAREIFVLLDDWSARAKFSAWDQSVEKIVTPTPC